MCRRLLLAASLLVFTCRVFAADAPASSKPEAGQQRPEAMSVTLKTDYLLFLPQGYGQDKDKKWPLIVFLHGSGESGHDIDVVKKHGPPKLVETTKKDLPFVVVSPQCPDSREGWSVPVLNKLLDEVLANYQVDPDRVYLTGLSMGGFGTWQWASRYADRFAAIAPICGGGDPRRVNRLKDTPIWVFHGEKDPTVPIRMSEEMVDALKKAGNDTVKFTRYPDLQHDSWTVTYNNPELYDWFLQHKREHKTQASK